MHNEDIEIKKKQKKQIIIKKKQKRSRKKGAEKQTYKRTKTEQIDDKKVLVYWDTLDIKVIITFDACVIYRTNDTFKINIFIVCNQTGNRVIHVYYCV